MIALVGVDRRVWGVVGAPAVAELHDGKGVVADAELLAEAIGLEYAAIYRRESVSDGDLTRVWGPGELTCWRSARVHARA